MTTRTELHAQLYDSLKELGLTESEASLYIVSLSLGPTTIAALAEHLGMPRPNVYKVIAGLERHGLARFSERKKYVRSFVVESPTVVLDRIRRKREAVANLDKTLAIAMPDLLSKYHQGETPTKVKVFEGREQWLETFFSLLDETKETMSFFGSADAFIGLISWETERAWIKKRMKRGIHINVLLTPGKDAVTLSETDDADMRTTRFFRGSVPFVTGFMLYANKVAIWQPKAPLVLQIEDEYIAQMHRAIFDALWKRA